MDDEIRGSRDSSDDEDNVLDPEQSRRLSELFDLQDRGRLTEAERAELDALVDAWGRAVNERGIRELAARRGVPAEQMQSEVLAGVDRALAWWRAVQDDPAQFEAVMHDAEERQRARRLG